MNCNCIDLDKKLQTRAKNSTSIEDMGRVRDMYATSTEFMTTKCKNKRNLDHLPTPLAQPVKLVSAACMDCKKCVKKPRGKALSDVLIKQAEDCLVSCQECFSQEEKHMRRASSPTTTAISRLETELATLKAKGAAVRCRDFELSIKGMAGLIRRASSLQQIKSLQTMVENWIAICQSCGNKKPTVKLLQVLQLELLKKRRRLL